MLLQAFFYLYFMMMSSALFALEPSSQRSESYVAGYHFYYPNGREVLDTTTMATDCSIYDGWWAFKLAIWAC